MKGLLMIRGHGVLDTRITHVECGKGFVLSSSDDLRWSEVETPVVCVVPAPAASA